MFEPSPWFDQIDPKIAFPISSYLELLDELNWPDHNQWFKTWDIRGGVDLAFSAWPIGTKSDWIWGLGFPILSDIERYFQSHDQRILFGISGLPGCGKTSLGKWIEAAASELNWSVEVISLDDFYLPSKELDKAMHGNPWRVPRALPGSHSIQLLEESIETWKSTGNLKAPRFDKTLRNGLGDRSGWSSSKPDVLVIEGWLLGCQLANNIGNLMNNLLSDNQYITKSEMDYQLILQGELKRYQPIWEKFERIWHIKAIDFKSTEKWKTQQEFNLERERGVSIKGEALDRFNRMIQTAIPIDSLQSVKSDVVVKLNTSREIMWVGPRKYETCFENTLIS